MTSTTDAMNNLRKIYAALENASAIIDWGSGNWDVLDEDEESTGEYWDTKAVISCFFQWIQDFCTGMVGSELMSLLGAIDKAFEDQGHTMPQFIQRLFMETLVGLNAEVDTFRPMLKPLHELIDALPPDSDNDAKGDDES